MIKISWTKYKDQMINIRKRENGNAFSQVEMFKSRTCLIQTAWFLNNRCHNLTTWHVQCNCQVIYHLGCQLLTLDFNSVNESMSTSPCQMHTRLTNATCMSASGFSRLRINAASCFLSSSTMEANVEVDGGLSTTLSTQGLMGKNTNSSVLTNAISEEK